MGLSVAKMLKRIPQDRLRDITRTALILRRLSEEEMLRQGIAWIEEALWLASQHLEFNRSGAGGDGDN